MHAVYLQLICGIQDLFGTGVMTGTSAYSGRVVRWSVNLLLLHLEHGMTLFRVQKVKQVQSFRIPYTGPAGHDIVSTFIFFLAWREINNNNGKQDPMQFCVSSLIIIPIVILLPW